mgnify:CR=1 FL=1
MKLLFLGDVMGRTGRAAIAERLPSWRAEWGLDFIVVNALFESALFDLKAIVHSQRLKYAAQRRNKSAVFRALHLV